MKEHTRDENSIAVYAEWCQQEGLKFLDLCNGKMRESVLHAYRYARALDLAGLGSSCLYFVLALSACRPDLLGLLANPFGFSIES